MVISRNEKNAVFDDFPIKKNASSNKFLMKIGTQGTKISIFSHFSKVEIYFKQLIVKISNSEICYFGKFIRISSAKSELR